MAGTIRLDMSPNRMIANELLAKLNNLTLCGQNEDGELEWIGTAKQWKKARTEEESVLSEYYQLKNF